MARSLKEPRPIFTERAHRSSVRRFAWRIGFWSLVAFGVFWLGGFLSFVSSLPSQAIAPVAKADGIVVLTGGAERVETGLRLLEEGWADRLLISGVHPDATPREVIASARTTAEGERVNGGEDDPFACCIDLDYVARDTIENARETREWAQARGYRTLIVVTAAYHMPRSLLELEHELPGVELTPYPVFPAAIDRDGWWSSPRSARLLAWEYTKYLLSLARLSL